MAGLACGSSYCPFYDTKSVIPQILNWLAFSLCCWGHTCRGEPGKMPTRWRQAPAPAPTQFVASPHSSTPCFVACQTRETHYSLGSGTGINTSTTKIVSMKQRARHAHNKSIPGWRKPATTTTTQVVVAHKINAPAASRLLSVAWTIVFGSPTIGDVCTGIQWAGGPVAGLSS
jgi:hypothetical protein